MSGFLFDGLDKKWHALLGNNFLSYPQNRQICIQYEQFLPICIYRFKFIRNLDKTTARTYYQVLGNNSSASNTQPLVLNIVLAVTQ